jgi:hypothetical protein
MQPYMGLGNSLQTAQASVGGGGSSGGGWVELGRTTLGSAGDLISVASLSDKRYYMILTDTVNSGTVTNFYRFNNDSGSNYSQRTSRDGGVLETDTSCTQYDIGLILNTYPEFTVQYLANLSAKEKLVLSHKVRQNTAGAATAPLRLEGSGKWANTSTAFNRIDAINNQSGDYAIGSEVVVLGWDPADTHTSDFWEELYSGDLSGGVSDTLDSGTITAKKYLWVQFYVKSVTGVTRPTLRLNSDTGSNYANRESHNGAADATNTSVDKAYITSIDIPVNTGYLGNMFIINNAANEKLVIQHGVYGNTAGAGTAPLRVESVAKWINTSVQATSVQIINDRASADFNTVSTMKVWGSN